MKDCYMENRRVLVIGSAENSSGGISSVIKTMKTMEVWNDYHCWWLGTQIQSNYYTKFWYALKAAFMAIFLVPQYDIIHFHTVPDRLGLLIQLPELLLAKLWKKKVIMHIHMGNQLEQHTRNGLFKWCLKRADKIVLLADRWKKMFTEWYPDIKIDTTVAYNAVRSYEAIPYNKRNKYILFAGYLDDNKACNLLLKAFDKIRDKHNEWSLEILGNGDVSRFKQMAKDMDLTDVALFEGYVEGERKQSFFQHASIHCLCSYNEGFPMVVLEAWEYGIPVISTPVGGLPDVIEEGKNIITFDFGDIEQLATKLDILIDDYELRERMSAYSQDFVKEHFSIQAVNNTWREIYKTL